MKILLIGGTGTISSEITNLLTTSSHELYLLNRGSKPKKIPEGVHHIICDINDEELAQQVLSAYRFDVVVDFIAFELDQVKRDVKIFRDKTKQYVFISSASAYQKPMVDPYITEGTTLSNPYWEYSRNKIACENYLMQQHRDFGFPVTIVRPSHTYNTPSIPLALHGGRGAWSTIQRMMDGKPVIIPGDGTSLWTMTHSKDFAQGFVGLLGNPHAIGQCVHITNDEHLTWNQVYQILASKLDVKLNPLYVPSDFLAHAGKAYGYDHEGALLGDKSNTVIFDNTKIKTLVPEFVADIRYDQGVETSLHEILNNPELQVEDPKFDEFCDRVAEVFTKARESFQVE